MTNGCGSAWLVPSTLTGRRHRYQQSTLGAGTGAVDFIRQQHLGEQGPGENGSRLTLIERLRPVRSAGQITGEADALERQADSLAGLGRVDLPVPGVSSISDAPWPADSFASRTWFCLPSRTAQVDPPARSTRYAPDPSGHGRVVDVEHQKLATAIGGSCLATGFPVSAHPIRAWSSRGMAS